MVLAVADAAEGPDEAVPGTGARLGVEVVNALGFKGLVASRSPALEMSTGVAEAKRAECQFVLRASYTQWEDNATAWSMNPDRLTVAGEVFHAASGRVVSSASHQEVATSATLKSGTPERFITSAAQALVERLVGAVGRKRVKPQAFLGFALSGGRSDALRACREQGFQSQNEGPYVLCSGTAQDMGWSASTKLGFCADRICRAEAERVLEKSVAASVKSYREVASQLQLEFGKPHERVESFSKKCTDIARFGECLRSGKGEARTTWRWGKEEVFELELRAPDVSDGAYRLSLAYREAKADELDVSAESAEVQLSEESREKGETQSSGAAHAERVCIPGQSFGCQGTAGCQGFQLCAADGTHLEACVCE